MEVKYVCSYCGKEYPTEGACEICEANCKAEKENIEKNIKEAKDNLINTYEDYLEAVENEKQIADNYFKACNKLEDSYKNYLKVLNKFREEHPEITEVKFHDPKLNKDITIVPNVEHNDNSLSSLFGDHPFFCEFLSHIFK